MYHWSFRRKKYKVLKKKKLDPYSLNVVARFEISADISGIYRVSVFTDMICPTDSQLMEISEFYRNYRRYFRIYRPFCQFIRIFPEISATTVGQLWSNPKNVVVWGV